MSALTETVKAKVDAKTKAKLQAEAARTERSEGAVVRLALRDYLNGKGRRDATTDR